jgi:hypothetical protein
MYFSLAQLANSYMAKEVFVFMHIWCPGDKARYANWRFYHPPLARRRPPPKLCSLCAPNFFGGTRRLQNALAIL